MLKSWKERAKPLKESTYALYLAARDPRVPPIAKVMATLSVAYALSPIDLIPDFIPVLGYLDDLILIPLGIALAIKMIPKQVWEECRQRASVETAEGLPNSRKAAFVIVAIWVLTPVLVGIVLWRWVRT